MTPKIMLVDDDKVLIDLLKEYLEGFDYEVISRTDGLMIVEALERENPDMIILDVMMPYRDGIEVLKDIRQSHNLPVIMLTARGEDADRIVGLELGADDYLAKPFNPRELLARIKAVWRRSGQIRADDGQTDRDRFIRVGGVKLDRDRRTMIIDAVETSLSVTEYKILRALMGRPDTVFSRDELMNAARGRDFMAFDRSIDVHISNLRGKIKSHPNHRQRIKTVWGSGYMFVSKT